MTQEWKLEERTIYELNPQGTNKWTAYVQPGWAIDTGKMEGSTRTTETELEEVARLMHAAPALLNALMVMIAFDSRAYIRQSDLAKDLLVAKKGAWAAIAQATGG